MCTRCEGNIDMMVGGRYAYYGSMNNDCNTHPAAQNIANDV